MREIKSGKVHKIFGSKKKLKLSVTKFQKKTLREEFFHIKKGNEKKLNDKIVKKIER